jgi:hypothetical protein
LNARWAFKPTTYGYEPPVTDASKANEQYICIVHTVVLNQSLAGIYCQTQHIEHLWFHTIPSLVIIENLTTNFNQTWISYVTYNQVQ